MEMIFGSTTEMQHQQNQKSLANKSEKFLTFVLDGEEYGIEILKIKEIIGMMSITSVPQSSPQLKGVINLRGRIIPIFDLRLIFGMEEKEHDSETCIIIVDIKNHLAGIIVDTVSEVMDIKEEDVETGSDLENKINTQFILGISNVRNRIKILIDVDAILKNENLSF